MDVNENERLSKITDRHEFKLRNNALIAVLHFTVTVWFSAMSESRTLILV
jgi:hypothetical protein